MNITAKKVLILTWISVAMSLVASFISGITLLGASTEIYVYGIQFSYSLFGLIMMGIFMVFIIIPVFYDLKIVSMFKVNFFLSCMLCKNNL
jgi:Na+/proline symporter